MISKNQIKYIQSLHLKKNREKETVFIIEGVKLVTEFLQNKRYSLKEVFASADFVEENAQLLREKEIKVTEVAEEELKKISLLTTPNKVLALVHANRQELDKSLLQNSLSLYLDDIRDPGNLGTIIRIADWFGISQVICSKTSTELYNPKTLQASMGAVLRVNVHYMDFEDVQQQAPNIPVYGAVLNGQTIYRADLKPGLLVIGNEANGISESILKQITVPVTIPAAGNNGSESLNAANACAIICSEFHRQLNYK